MILNKPSRKCQCGGQYYYNKREKKTKCSKCGCDKPGLNAVIGKRFDIGGNA
jgi:hypothetical protein